MRELVPACHVGTISAFEQMKVTTTLGTLFSGSTDRWFIAPICTSCHGRFADLNRTDFGSSPDFEML